MADHQRDATYWRTFEEWYVQARAEINYPDVRVIPELHALLLGCWNAARWSQRSETSAPVCDKWCGRPHCAPPLYCFYADPQAPQGSVGPAGSELGKSSEPAGSAPSAIQETPRSLTSGGSSIPSWYSGSVPKALKFDSPSVEAPNAEEVSTTIIALLAGGHTPQADIVRRLYTILDAQRSASEEPDFYIDRREWRVYSSLEVAQNRGCVADDLIPVRRICSPDRTGDSK